MPKLTYANFGEYEHGCTESLSTRNSGGCSHSYTVAGLDFCISGHLLWCFLKAHCLGIKQDYLMKDILRYPAFKMLQIFKQQQQLRIFFSPCQELSYCFLALSLSIYPFIYSIF